jgi:hypothetical protein
MLSVKRTTYNSFALVLALFISLQLSAQENSPFSRYGLGDLYPQQNIATRGMGGVSAAYANDQALNTNNPASYGAMRYINVYGGSRGALVTYDFGVSIDARTLRNATPFETYHSTNFLPSYLQIGIPLGANAYKKNSAAGMVFGLKPATRINYSVASIEQTPIDSVETLYEGTGGLNQAFIGLAKRWGNFSIGFNGGYEFGRKEISTKVIILDTIHYYKSNSSSTTTFNGFFLQPGISYNLKLNEVAIQNKNYKEGYFLRLGASGTLEHKLKASADLTRETFEYDANGAVLTLDSVYKAGGQSGHITFPLTYTTGFMFSKKYLSPGGEVLANKWSVGLDYSMGKWKDYRFYNLPDKVINNWMIRGGAEFVPSLFKTSLFSRATYRLGFYTGKDYINADGNEYKVKALTLGFGFYLRKYSNYDNNSSFINTAIEFGKRGSNVNNVTENFFKVSVGLSLADIWFARRKYD